MSRKEKEKSRGISFWGGILGLIGGILGIVSLGLSLWDRFIPPKVDVLALMPVRVDSTNTSIPNVAYPYWGVSFIVHVQNRSKAVLLSGLDIRGKVYLSYSEYLGQASAEDRTIEDLEKERDARRPYRIVSWTAWLEDSRVPIRLEPNEERYVRYTLFEPKPVGGISGGDAYVGYESESKRPQLIYSYEPYIYWIFKIYPDKNRNMFVPRDIREEILNGDVGFKLRVDSKAVEIGPQKFKPYTAIHVRRWKSAPGQQLFYESLDSRSSIEY